MFAPGNGLRSPYLATVLLLLVTSVLTATPTAQKGAPHLSSPREDTLGAARLLATYEGAEPSSLAVGHVSEDTLLMVEGKGAELSLRSLDTVSLASRHNRRALTGHETFTLRHAHGQSARMPPFSIAQLKLGKAMSTDTFLLVFSKPRGSLMALPITTSDGLQIHLSTPFIYASGTLGPTYF